MLISKLQKLKADLAKISKKNFLEIKISLVFKITTVFSA